jgi:hypothetical protein
MTPQRLCHGNPAGLIRQVLNHFVTISSVGKSTAFPQTVKRHFAIPVFIGLVTSPLLSATLERLSLADMIGKSTGIVRATVGSSFTSRTGPVIYTHYQLQVSERYKGPAQSTVDLALPGGVADGIEQIYSGVPQLHSGEEYVFFLWTGKSGLTQVIGLTQGLFGISDVGARNPALRRTASREFMIDRTSGRRVEDQTLTMNLSALKSEIASTLSQQASAKQVAKEGNR